MAKAKRWTGEFLVAVDEQGRVMLPVLDPDAPAPTHYRISQPPYNSEHGELRLVPMKVATAEDLRPILQDDPEAGEDDNLPGRYTLDERAALSVDCPYCGANSGQACFARPSGKTLHDYEGSPNVHKDRLRKVVG